MIMLISEQEWCDNSNISVFTTIKFNRELIRDHDVNVV